MHVQATVTIHKNITDVWNVMGYQFAEVHIWSSNFQHSEAGGEALFNGLGYSFRKTTTERGTTVQLLETFDATNHTLSYRITEGAPEIAKEANSTWALKEVEANSTKVILDFYLEPKMELNQQMEAKIKSGLQASSQLIADELKYYLENGKPHSNKLSQLKTNV